MPHLKLIELIYGPENEVTINHHLDYYPLTFRAGLGITNELARQYVTPGRVETVINYLKLFNACVIKDQTFHDLFIEACTAEDIFKNT